MKIKLSIVLVLLFAVGGYVAATPYITLGSMRDALSNNDPDAFNANVDFPAVRQDMKERISLMVMEKTRKESNNNPLAAFAASFAGKFTDRLVDGLVTPAAIAKMMSGSTIKEASKGGGTVEPDPEQMKKAVDNARMGYDSFNQFSVWMTSDNGKETRFVLGRSGIGWKLIRIELPLDGL